MYHVSSCHPHNIVIWHVCGIIILCKVSFIGLSLAGELLPVLARGNRDSRGVWQAEGGEDI